MRTLRRSAATAEIQALAGLYHRNIEPNAPFRERIRRSAQVVTRFWSEKAHEAADKVVARQERIRTESARSVTFGKYGAIGLIALGSLVEQPVITQPKPTEPAPHVRVLSATEMADITPTNSIFNYEALEPWDQAVRAPLERPIYEFDISVDDVTMGTVLARVEARSAAETPTANL